MFTECQFIESQCGHSLSPVLQGSLLKRGGRSINKGGIIKGSEGYDEIMGSVILNSRVGTG